MTSHLHPPEVDHLKGCAACRVERRRYTSAAEEAPADDSYARRLGDRVGPWEIERLLGQGGTATVYRVRHVTFGSLAALKLLRRNTPELADRLVQEGTLQANLDHPNVLRVYDIEHVDACPALVLEYVDGPDLGRRLGMSALDMTQVDALVRGMLSGISAAHERGLVHRDLKPSNVLLAGSDQQLVPKISDFGLAKVLGNTVQLTGSDPMGTPVYMPPEQFYRPGAVDHRADIYAVGCVLFELLTGRRFGPGAIAELDRRGPCRMVAAIESALAQNPDERPSSCEELLAIWDGLHAGTAPKHRIGAVVALDVRGDRGLPAAAATAADRKGLSSVFHANPYEEGLLWFPTTVDALGFVEAYRAVVRSCAAAAGSRAGLCAAVYHGPMRPLDRGKDPATIVAGTRSLLEGAHDDRVLVSSLGKCTGESYSLYRILGVVDPVQVFVPASHGAWLPPPDTELAWRLVPTDGSLRPARKVPHRLPHEPARLMGREAEQAQVEALLMGHQIVGIRGPDGIGKTVFASSVGWSTLGSWTAGVWYVGLAETTNKHELAQRLARVIDPLPNDAGDDLDSLGEHLAGLDRSLLILDGIDVLEVGARALLARWLEKAPRLRVLFTTSDRATLPGATTIELSMLSAPATLDDARRAGDPVVSRLFVDRVASITPHWAPSAAGARAIDRLIELVGGLPLAIELVAGQAHAGDIDALSSRLAEAVPARASAEDALRAVLLWVWNQLNDCEKSALAQCTVFVGGFSTAAAAQLLCLAPWPDVSASRLIERLARRFLIRRVSGGRLDLHPMVRSLAASEMELQAAFRGSGPELVRAARARHAVLFVRDDRPQDIADEVENVLAACEHSIVAGEAYMAVATCRVLASALGETDCTAGLAERALRVPSLSRWGRAHLLTITSRGRSLLDQLSRHRSPPTRALDQALDRLNEAIELFVACDQALEVAEVALRRAEMHRAMRRIGEARHDYTRALAIPCGKAEATVHILLRVASLEAEFGRRSQEQAYCRRAIDAAGSSSDLVFRAVVHEEVARMEYEGQRRIGTDLSSGRRERQLSMARMHEHLRIARELRGHSDPGEPTTQLPLRPGASTVHTLLPDVTTYVEPPRAPHVTSEPDRTEWVLRGRMMADAGQHDRALGWFGTIRDPPRRARAVFEVGRLHQARGNIDQATSCYDTALTTSRRSWSRDPWVETQSRAALSTLSRV